MHIYYILLYCTIKFRSPFAINLSVYFFPNSMIFYLFPKVHNKLQSLS